VKNATDSKTLETEQNAHTGKLSHAMETKNPAGADGPGRAYVCVKVLVPLTGSTFKTFNRVQDRGGQGGSTAGIYGIFRGL